MIIVLKRYLAKLEADQDALPETERRAVPTLTQLAKDVGLSRVQMSRLATNNTEGIKFSIGAEIIEAMRERGFSMQVSDLLEYRD